MSITDRYLEIKDEVNALMLQHGRDPAELELIAVSKTRSIKEIQEVYHAGGRNFGENRIQEAISKIPSSPKEIHWHLIGSLQKNKVNKAIDVFTLIHSVDSLELAIKISEKSQEFQTRTPILVQVNTSEEATKHGFSKELTLSSFEILQALPGVELQGFMTMAPFTKDEKIVRSCFSQLRELRDQLSTKENPLKHLSMGMSNDYRWAIAEGATLIRVGRHVFEG